MRSGSYARQITRYRGRVFLFNPIHRRGDLVPEPARLIAIAVAQALLLAGSMSRLLRTYLDNGSQASTPRGRLAKHQFSREIAPASG
jgi:hypothetical protein